MPAHAGFNIIGNGGAISVACWRTWENERHKHKGVDKKIPRERGATGKKDRKIALLSLYQKGGEQRKKSPKKYQKNTKK